jgi:D-alanyl-D-alanine dipeptidase
MSKGMKLLIGIYVLVMAALIGVIWHFTALRAEYDRFYGEPLSMPADGALQLTQEEDGAVRLSWPASAEADSYLTEVISLAEGAGDEPLFFTVCADTACILPSSLPEDVPVALRVYARRTRRIAGREEERLCAEPLTAACYLNRPEAWDLSAFFDPENNRATVFWSGWQGDTYRLYLRRGEGEAELFRELDSPSLELRFGPGGDLPVPAMGERCIFSVDARRETAGLRFLGKGPAEEVTLTRDGVLGTELRLECTAEDDSSWVLRWNETRGETYQVLRRDGGDGEWTVAAEIPAGEERVYRTGHLPPYGEYSFRVAALDGQKDYAAGPAQADVRTEATLAFAAAWPLRELSIYASPDGKEELGVLPADKAVCVLGEENSFLLVATPDLRGYADGRFCMVNLPDYIGDLCDYEIANGSASRVTVHEYAVPGVTDAVVAGYESARLSSGEYLVPLLYPSAVKLIAAAKAAEEDGFRLRICDAFRPGRASRELLERTQSVLDSPVPAETRSGAAPGEPPQTKAGQTPTYRFLMTNDIYSLGDFLAADGAGHGIGAALDVTLVRPADGWELKMQSSLHDLSWYSNIGRNNSNAVMLARIMTGAGFRSVNSEWWHFVDGDALAAELPVREAGVTAEGWLADDGGWRYRLADGTCLVSVAAEIDGKERSFDEEGYLLP